MTARTSSLIQQSVLHALEDAVRDDGRAILAVSGGVDSMVLLDAAAAVLRAERLVVATFDHGTGAHATDAASMVVERALALGIECISERAQTQLSSEAELRGARWRFLRDVAYRFNGNICTAHTADDQIETVLMRIMRDAGARGLAALLADGEVVRPLLKFRRADIIAYARGRRLTWVDDPSNASRTFLRNRLRHDLLPSMRRVRPSIDADLLAIGESAAHWRAQVEDFVERNVGVRALAGGRGLDVRAQALAGYSLEALAILWPAIAARAGVTLDRRGTKRLAEFTAGGRVGAQVQLSGGWEVIRSRDALQLRASRGAVPTPSRLALSDTTSWSDWSFRPARHDDANDAWFAWLPPNRPLVVRTWVAGDSMRAFPSGRLRKVKHLLTKAGLTGHQRRVWPVVVAEDGGEIVWIPGVRRSDAASDPAAGSGVGLSFFCEYVNR